MEVSGVDLPCIDQEPWSRVTPGFLINVNASLSCHGLRPRRYDTHPLRVSYSLFGLDCLGVRPFARPLIRLLLFCTIILPNRRTWIGLSLYSYFTIVEPRTKCFRWH